MGAVHHEGVPVYARLGQVTEDVGEHPQPGPPGKAVIERLVRPIDGRSILPAQTIAQDEQSPAQHSPIVHARLAPGLRKVRPQPLHLLVA
jgi:hypothetical protein